MKASEYNHVIVTGSIAYDDIMDFPNKFVNFFQPDKLHQINISFVVDKLEKQIGGTATNIAYNVRLMTNTSLNILGAVGKDGDVFLDFLRKHKISTEGVLVDDELYTATGKAITDIDDNQIWGFYYGASVRGKDIDVSRFATKKSLLLICATHIESFLHFQREAIKSHIEYLYDPGMVITTLSAAQLKEGVLHSKLFVGNDYEVSQIMKMTGLTVNFLLKNGITVITTLGDQGVRYQNQTEDYTVPAYHLTKPVDPTGAGDAWRGGFVSAYVEGEPIIECLKQGNALASFAVEKYGTVNHKPSKEAVKKRMAKLLVSEV